MFSSGVNPHLSNTKERDFEKSEETHLLKPIKILLIFLKMEQKHRFLSAKLVTSL